MDCTRCAEDLTAFLDGELSATDSEQVRLHLDSCASCSGELRSLQEAAHFVKSHQHELDIRPEAWNLVRARISVSSDSRQLFRFLAPNRWRLAWAALAVVAVFVLGYNQYRQAQRQSLDNYISQYIQDRRTHEPPQPVFTDFMAKSANENSHVYNPFVELKTTLTDNPFRLEDR